MLVQIFITIFAFWVSTLNAAPIEQKPKEFVVLGPGGQLLMKPEFSANSPILQRIITLNNNPDESVIFLRPQLPVNQVPLLATKQNSDWWEQAQNWIFIIIGQNPPQMSSEGDEVVVEEEQQVTYLNKNIILIPGLLTEYPNLPGSIQRKVFIAKNASDFSAKLGIFPNQPINIDPALAVPLLITDTNIINKDDGDHLKNIDPLKITSSDTLKTSEDLNIVTQEQSQARFIPELDEMENIKPEIKNIESDSKTEAEEANIKNEETKISAEKILIPVSVPEEKLTDEMPSIDVNYGIPLIHQIPSS